jgi:hypothetical protein
MFSRAVTASYAVILAASLAGCMTGTPVADLSAYGPPSAGTGEVEMLADLSAPEVVAEQIALADERSAAFALAEPPLATDNYAEQFVGGEVFTAGEVGRVANRLSDIRANRLLRSCTGAYLSPAATQFCSLLEDEVEDPPLLE